MTILEIFLLIIGVMFIIGSFFISERLSQSDIEQLKKMSEDEVNRIIDDKLANAKSSIEDTLQDTIENAIYDLETKTDKETNNKILHISEYSEGVIQNMDKTHTEITFMYSMLNEKQGNITDLTKDIQTLQDELAKINSSIAKKMELLNEKEIEINSLVQEQAKAAFTPFFPENIKIENEVFSSGSTTADKPFMASSVDYIQQAALNSESSESVKNGNLDILRLHDEGFSDVEIAKQLNRGLGEVKFVLGLYQED